MSSIKERRSATENKQREREIEEKILVIHAKNLRVIMI